MKVNQVDNRLFISAETEFEEEYLKHTFMQKNIKCFLKFGADLTNMIGIIVEPCEKPVVDSVKNKPILKVKIIDMINELEDVALNSVSYVGTANYPKRELEAKQSVRNKAKELIDALNHEHN